MKSFSELSLNPSLLKALTEMGIETPTPIQAQALPLLMGEPTDFIGLAATGTGKTIAFGLPLLERIEPKARATQALILCPTRELAVQVTGQINLLSRYLSIKALPIYGGADYGPQIRGLKDGVAIVVGTPGRVVDHLTKGTLSMSKVGTVILDEADEMISMGFKDDLEAILEAASSEGSPDVWLFSATMGREVKSFSEKFLKSPKQVALNRTEMVPELLDQIYYRAHESDKPEIVCKLIDAAEDFYGIIFCQTKALVTDLTQYLKERGYAADCLHGDMEQPARTRAMQAFRDRKYTVLVCTDVASRGLDVKDISHVINYSLPRELDSYVHRIGRTARSGKTGMAMSLVTPSHRALIGRIENLTKSRMREGKLPTRKEIGLKKVSSMLGKFEAQKGHKRAAELMDAKWKEAVEGMDKEEIVSRFISLAYPELFVERDEQSSEMAPRMDGAARGERRGDGREDERRGGGRDDRRGRYEDRGPRQSRDERGSYAPRPRTEYAKPNGVKISASRPVVTSKPAVTSKPVTAPKTFAVSKPVATVKAAKTEHSMIRPPEDLGFEKKVKPFKKSGTGDFKKKNPWKKDARSGDRA